MSATMKPTAWCIAIGRSKVTRSFEYSSACSYAACATPTAPIAVPGRVKSSVAIAILKPSPSSPSRFSAGTRTSCEREGGRVGRALAHLLEVLLDRDAGRAHLDDEGRHAATARGRIRLREDDGPLGVAGVRDERLRAVEDVLVAVAHRGRPQRGDVRARTRLRERERAEDRLLDERRQPASLLLLPCRRAMTGPEPRPFAVIEVPMPEQPQ